MCLNETYGKIQIGTLVSYKFPFQNGLKEGNALSSLLFNCDFKLQNVPVGMFKKIRRN
jgi:hypothetical protein